MLVVVKFSVRNSTENLQIKISELNNEIEKNNGFEKRYNMTKNVCYELEDQVKEYERIIEKLETSQERLTQTNTELKGKNKESDFRILVPKVKYSKVFPPITLISIL